MDVCGAARVRRTPNADQAEGPEPQGGEARGQGTGQSPRQDPGRPQAATPDPTKTAPGRTKSDVRRSDIYGDRLDGLQSEVDALKDKIFRSKARLSLLKETVLRRRARGESGDSSPTTTS